MRRTLMCIPALLVAAACGGEAGGAADWGGTLEDSAGVQLVKNSLTPLWGEGDAWTLEEVMTIGEAAGDPDYQFGQIAGIAVTSDRRIVLVDQQAQHLKVFLQIMPGPEGSLWVQRVQEPTGMTAEERETWNPLLDLGASAWDILDAEGRYLGVLDVPHRFQPVTFEGDMVYGIWRDEFDVQYVRVMRIVGLEATASEA